MKYKPSNVDEASCVPLLNLIARAESSGNYNAYFGNAANTSVSFTTMSISDVLAWQVHYSAQGSPSNAVGRYQIINATLNGLVREMDIDTSQRFDEKMQDRMAMVLLERRGVEAYVNQKITRDTFAANLAKEWAALPKVIGNNPYQSYYASDGLNKSLVSVNDIRKAIEPIRPRT